MSNRNEVEGDRVRAAQRRNLHRALSSGISRELRRYDVELVGLAILYQEDYCTLTVKADIAGTRKVAFVSGDSMVTCIIAAYKLACSGSLKFRHDKYANSEV